MRVALAFVLVLTTEICLHVEAFITPNTKLEAALRQESGNTTKVPFGVIQGYASINVPGYSNGNDTYISDQYNYVYGIYTGIKWQCVEYARRWLFMRKGCVFDSIDGAADMWTQLKTVQRVVDGRSFPLKTHPNGSPVPPRNESLLIYQRATPDMPYGHVSVIVDVLAQSIRVAEENYHFRYWPGNYSREIPYVYRNGSYYIQDDYPILGWMSVEDNNQTRPLDQNTINAIIKLNTSSTGSTYSKGSVFILFYSLYLFSSFFSLHACDL